MNTDELYQQLLFDHARHSQWRGTLADSDYKIQLFNPLCGDEVTFFLLPEKNGETIQSVRFEGKGCMISQASASMLAQAIEGRTFQEAFEILSTFRSVMKGEEAEARLNSFGDLEALSGVKHFPVRIKCALLPFDAVAKLMGVIMGEAESMT